MTLLSQAYDPNRDGYRIEVLVSKHDMAMMHHSVHQQVTQILADELIPHVRARMKMRQLTTLVLKEIAQRIVLGAQEVVAALKK